MTHPFHPRFGETLEVIRFHRCWGEERVFYRCPESTQKQCSMPISWTDAAVADPFVTLSAGRSAFRISDLLALAEMLAGGCDKEC